MKIFSQTLRGMGFFLREMKEMENIRMKREDRTKLGKEVEIRKMT